MGLDDFLIILFDSSLTKKPPDVTKSRKMKTEQVLRVDDHDFTMRPAFGGKTLTCLYIVMTEKCHSYR